MGNKTAVQVKFQLSRKVKKLLLEKLRDLRDTMPRHFDFYYHHVTYRTPCHASDHLVTARATDLRERFLLSGVSYLTLLPASFKASLGAGTSTSKLASPFVWITTIHKKVTLVGVTKGLWLVACVKNLLPTGLELSSWQAEYVGSLMVYPFSHRATQSTIN